MTLQDIDSLLHLSNKLHPPLIDQVSCLPLLVALTVLFSLGVTLPAYGIVATKNLDSLPSFLQRDLGFGLPLLVIMYLVALYVCCHVHSKIETKYDLKRQRLAGRAYHNLNAGLWKDKRLFGSMSGHGGYVSIKIPPFPAQALLTAQAPEVLRLSGEAGAGLPEIQVSEVTDQPNLGLNKVAPVSRTLGKDTLDQNI